MSELLIKPYEISAWEDELTQDGEFIEHKLAVIGSNTMTGLNKVYNPVFNKKANGEKTLTFSLKYKYFNPYTGNEDVINPFVNLLTNERKVKLHYDGQWYEFIIKEHSESSDGLEWTYTCTDAFVLELSKRGYNITFDTELNNNQGTARELAEETLKDTEWRIPDDGVDNFKQLIAEPIYKGVINNSFSALNLDTNVEEICSGNVYVFYSYIKNKNGKFLQFIKQAENYTIDDKNVITATNYRILRDNITVTDTEIKSGNVTLITLGEIETKYQANRLAYNQLTTYDPVMQRTVDRFDAAGHEVYRYIDYVYTTSDIVINYITNGDNFNVLEDGTLQGWNPYVDSTDKIKPLELVTKPELGTGAQLADLSTLSQIEGFLKVQFNGALTSDYKNAVFNSGIENNAFALKSIAKGDKFVFRWRAGKGEVENLQPENRLRLLVAKYTQDAPTRFGYYYKHIDKDNIILDFKLEENQTLGDLNNIIDNGSLQDYYFLTTDTEINSEKTYYIRTEVEGESVYTPVDNPDVSYIDTYYEKHKQYVVDSVVQVPSTKYIYVNSDEPVPNRYVWDGLAGDFKEFDGNNYLPYYYLVAEAQQAIPNTSLQDVTEKYGIFVYTTGVDTTTEIDEETQETITTINPIYIQDIQLTRYIPDVGNENKPIIMGNIPTATSISTEYYYLKPAEGAAAEDIIMYTSVEKLAESLGILPTDVVALYNEDSIKNLTISASKSNCFDILQTVAETFECWIDLVVQHDDKGYILYDEDGIPEKYVYLREYAGDNNYAGFKYGINLNSIERTINSDEFVTKLIVDQSQSEYVDEGYVSIGLAPSNISKESYILNFDYYYNQGLLNKEMAEPDRLNFISEVADLNLQIQEKEKTRRDLEASMTALGSKRNVYTELIATAQDSQTESLGDFENLTNRTYSEYQDLQKNGIIYDGDTYIRTDDTEVQEGKEYYIHTIVDEEDVFEKVENPSGDPSVNEWYEILPDFTQEETIVDLVGMIYVSSATINNYSGLLTNIDSEYWKVRKELRGVENYSFKIWTAIDANEERHVYLEVNDYLPEFSFEFEGSTYPSTVGDKYFDIISEHGKTFTFTAPPNYIIKNTDDEVITSYEINDSTVVNFRINYIGTEPVGGIALEIKELQEEKNDLTADFNNKYSRYIQEGTWNSTDYIDSELYYLDALQVSNTSAQPTVSYTIDVVEVSELEGLEGYLFDAGDKTYVEDAEFFGWHIDNIGTVQEPKFIYTPAKEEVIVSEVEWHLDEADKNTITVQNYKTRFEDFFQRISATVQTVQYNEATYAKISSLVDPDGTINQNILLESLNNLAGKQYNLTSDGSVAISQDVILIQNLTNPANRVIINSEGIRVSSDGGNNWTTAIDGQGINIGAVYTGTLNTNEVIIGSRDNPSFRWDKAGISAFKYNENNDEAPYDLQTYVRYDQYGLYGIKDDSGFKAQSLQDVLDKAHFAVTWDGFFIRNSYEDGGKVSITSDNDFQVIDGANRERIKIGSIGFDENDNRIYGINISNTNGDSVLSTDNNGNVTIVGTINATGGNFSDTVYVGKNTAQTSDYIIINGETASISSSNYNGGPSTSATQGWIINKDGDAVFNNITARGSIKTAVFEYAEIQAVGGVFIFRPSSAIRSAAVDGNDLVVTVEKPMLFKANQWCKVSNYAEGNDTDDGIADNPDSVNILNNNGLTHIYKVSRTQGSNNIILLDGAEMVEGANAVCDIDDLIGGSLVDMGNKTGTANYGIGINSSDNTVNLPARAISLFETVVDETQESKVSYNYRGILGTLPQMNYTGQNPQVSQLYDLNLKNTQGIYTDNMYIGDATQYIAFYTDKQDSNKKKLRINGADIYLTFEEGEQEQDLVDVINGIEVGEGLFLTITSSQGTSLNDSNITTTLTAHLYKAGEEVVPASGSQDTPEQVINALGFQINWYTYTENNVTHEKVETLIKSNSVTCAIGTGINDDISAVDSISITAKVEDVSI